MMSKKSPQLRFEGFTDDWEEHKLGDYIIQYSEKTKQNNQYPVFTSSRNGLFFQKDYYKGNQIASEDNIGYNIVPRGYFTYRHMSDDLVFKFNINDLADYGIVSTLYPVFTTNEQLNSKYLQYQLNEGSEFRRFSLLQKQGGSRTYMYLNKLQNMILNIPKLEEQQKIGSFFQQLDETIALHQRKLDLLKEQKKGYLQKMFPKNGSKIPELRFAGFVDDWEQRKLGDIFVYKQGQQVPVENQFTKRGKNRHRFIRIVDLTTKNEAPRYIEYSGDNIISSTDLFMIRYGQPGVIGYGYEGVIANNLFKLIPKIETYNLFFKYILDSMYPKIQSLSSSTTLPAISFKSLDVLEVRYPDKKEQQKIGSLFKQLDATIALHQRKLDLLKEQKKGFLQKMFV